MEFFSELATAERCAELSALDPCNPFATEAYARAEKMRGAEVWVLGCRQSGSLVLGCLGLLHRGRLRRGLSIPSLPLAQEPFWTGLRKFMRERRITNVELNTFASAGSSPIPCLGEETMRAERHEFAVRLDDPSSELLDRMQVKHRRLVRKAIRNGLQVRVEREASHLEDHVRLIGSSMQRRQDRGENISVTISAHSLRPYLESGFCCLYQALSGDEVVSSMMVANAPQGAYLHTSGTSVAGMATGASHFLLHEIMLAKQEAGVAIFNLGGVSDLESGLARYKRHFGANAIQLEAVTLYVGPVWRRKLTTLLQLARGNRKKLLSVLFGNFRLNKVYAAETSAAMPQAEVVGAEFLPLTEDDLRNLDVGDAGFRQRQLDRLARFGRSYAYGVLLEGKLAHISWLLPSAAVQIDSPVVLRAKSDQAEITACETLLESRGKGAYGFAVRNLFAVARQQGIERIYMKTAWNNRSSQRGILKAGLRSAGLVLLIAPPLMTGKTWVLRLFR